MRPAKAPFAVCAAMAMLISACSSSGGSGGKSTSKADANANLAKGGTFTVLAADDPGALVPFDNIQTPGVSMFKYIYSYLVAIDPNGKIVPELAKSYTLAGAKATFKLKSGVTCSDGTPLTASTVAANWNYVKDPANKSVLVGVLLPSNQFTVAADDSTNTFSVTFDKPFGFILQAISLFPIVCGKGLKNPKSLAEASSGSGPFVLTKATPGVEYDFAKRAGYTWGPNGASTSAAAFPDRVVQKIVASQSTATNLLVSKAANTAVINGPNGSRLTGAGFHAVQDLQGSIVMVFNQAPGRPTADLAVRKAMIMALDIPQLSSVVTQGLYTKPGYSLTPSKSACDDAAAVSAIPKHDLGAAKKLLDEAGWVPGSGGIRAKAGKQLAVTAPYLTTTAGDAPATDLLVTTWKQLGIKVTQQPLDQAGFTTAMFASGNYDVLPLAEFAVPFQSILTGFLSGPNPPKGINSAHVNTAGYTTNSGKAVTTNGSAGCAFWTDAAKALYTDADIIPISIMPVRWFSRLSTFDLSIGRIVPSSIRMHTK